MTSWVDQAGWTLVHFIWQGAGIALAAAAVLRILKSSSPQARYAVACAALALMLASPIVTAFALSGAPRSPLTDAVRLVRSPQGTVVGFSVAQPWSPPGAAAATAPATQVRFPVALNTDTVFSALVAFWLAGVAILLVRLAAGCWRLRRIHTAARLEPVSRWQTLADDIARRLGLRRRFSVVDSLHVATPTVIGWLRPVVLLPVAALSGLSPRQVEAILAHELAHIRRHDFAVNLLQTLAETVLFYHPAVWWMSARIRTEREHCCDDVAVAVCGNPAEYAAALTELASWSVTHAPLAMAATRGPLLTRIRRLLRLPEPVDRAPRRTTVAVALVLTTVVGIGIIGAVLRAQPLLGDNRQEFGPPQLHAMLVDFNLLPRPVQLPDSDPIGARAWRVTVGGDERELAMIGYTARGVIRQTYDLGPMPIVGAPTWMDTETFTLTAPANLTITDGLTDPEEVRAALQQLLEGDLGLTTHREMRTYPAYALVLANPDGRLGPSLKQATIDCFAGRREVRPNPDAAEVGPSLRQRHVTLRFCGIDNNFFGLSGARVTMAEFAREFHRQHYPLAPDREIVDRTGLSGTYDFELRFGMLPIAAMAHANPALRTVLAPLGVRSVFTALPEQLGLKLVKSTVSREVLVIDQINRP